MRLLLNSLAVLLGRVTDVAVTTFTVVIVLLLMGVI